MSDDFTPDRFLPYGRQYIDDADVKAVTDTLLSEYLTTGPKIAEFEQKLCELTGAKEAIVCSNGTTALHLACLAAGLKEGTAAIVPSMTFLATANAVHYCGAEVVFADVAADTGLMTEETFHDALKRATLPVRAVLPVHLTGHCVDIEGIRGIAEPRGIAVIVDSCHALGSAYQHKGQWHFAGSCAAEDMAVFSFHPVKTIAMGEGGAVTTNNSEWAGHMRRLRTHGMVMRPSTPVIPEQGLDEKGSANPWYYEMPEIGYNYRATDIQCALGLSQLEKLDYFIQQRQKIASFYNVAFADCAPALRLPAASNKDRPVYHLYAPRFDFKTIGMSRSSFMQALSEKKIGTQVHYLPVHRQPYYRDLYPELTLPGADAYYESTLSIPFFVGLNDNEAGYVAQQISAMVKR